MLNAPLVAGDKMLIVNQQAGLEEYVLATVVVPSSGRQKRVILDTAAPYGGTSFHRSGLNCFAPRGQSMMIPPVAEVVELILQHPSQKSIMSNRLFGSPGV